MKKIISQILLIILIITIGISSVFISQVNAASSAGLSVSSATEGGTFTVTLVISDENAAGANCNIEVTYSDGTKTTVGTGGETGIAYIKGMEAMGFGNTITFSAKVAGKTVIKATNINISDANGKLLEEGGSKEQTITIQARKTEPSPPPTPEPEPEPTPEPTPDSTPAPVPDNSEANSDNADSTNNTNTNTTTNTTTNNTTKEPEVVNPTFKVVNETVYALKGCNVRSSCSTDSSSNKIGGLVKGQAVIRTGIDDNWSRIDFNGKTAYVATRLLTTDKPIEETENTVNENNIKNTVSNNTVKNNTVKNNTVENSITENTTIDNELAQGQILNQIEQEIGVLPEVGHNIATIMFVMISIISLVMIMRLQYKLRE